MLMRKEEGKKNPKDKSSIPRISVFLSPSLSPVWGQLQRGALVGVEDGEFRGVVGASWKRKKNRKGSE